MVHVLEAFRANGFHRQCARCVEPVVQDGRDRLGLAVHDDLLVATSLVDRPEERSLAGATLDESRTTSFEGLRRSCEVLHGQLDGFLDGVHTCVMRPIGLLCPLGLGGHEEPAEDGFFTGDSAHMSLFSLWWCQAAVSGESDE